MRELGARILALQIFRASQSTSTNEISGSKIPQPFAVAFRAEHFKTLEACPDILQRLKGARTCELSNVPAWRFY